MGYNQCTFMDCKWQAVRNSCESLYGKCQTVARFLDGEWHAIGGEFLYGEWQTVTHGVLCSEWETITREFLCGEWQTLIPEFLYCI